MIRTILVEDDIEMLEGLKNVIDWESFGFTIVGSVRNGSTALNLLEKLHPDFIITDITMPGMDGLELISHAKKANPKIKSVIISCHEEFEYAREAMRLHANEYLLKHTLTEETLIQIITKIKETIDSEAKQLQDFFGLEQSYQLTEINNLYESYAPILKNAVKNVDSILLVNSSKELIKNAGDKYHPAPFKAMLSKLLIELAIVMPDSHGISVTALQLKDGSHYFLDTVQVIAEKLAKLKYNTTNPEILKAIEYIDKNIAENISCKAVSKHVNMNSNYFSRLFSKELGLNFSDFVLQKRIARATELLSNTKHSVDEIAGLVGIESVSYFYRIYKKMTGKTPGDVRK